MCELFAMSGKLPATVNISFKAFAAHGGVTGPHGDGWGIAYYEDGDVRLLKEAEPLGHSGWVDFMEAQGYRSTTVLSHIRKATVGKVALRNTQPFLREVAGDMHAFIHNGDVPGVVTDPGFALGQWRPVGDTDSEWAFCHLLSRLAPLWAGRSDPPSLDDRLAVLVDFAARMRPLGPANFIYSDGDALFLHGHERQQTDGTRRPPGLHTLCRECQQGMRKTLDGGVTVDTQGDQRVTLVASVPLSAEGWEPLPTGAVVALRAGMIVATAKP